MNAEDYRRAVSVENVRGETVPAGRAAQSDEIRSILQACEQSPIGVRDAAMLALLYGTGLRRAELVALDVDDYDPSSGMLRVQGKGNERMVPASAPGVVAALHDWLTVRGRRPGALFWGMGNRNRGERLTDQIVYHVLRKRSREAGVEDISPHDLRRTFASDALDGGADLVTVQKIMGHADPGTTARYDRRGEEAMHRAVSSIDVPYQQQSLMNEND